MASRIGTVVGKWAVCLTTAFVLIWTRERGVAKGGAPGTGASGGPSRLAPTSNQQS